MAVAIPVRPKWLWATTATSLTGSCSGPQHCWLDYQPGDRPVHLVGQKTLGTHRQQPQHIMEGRVHGEILRQDQGSAGRDQAAYR